MVWRVEVVRLPALVVGADVRVLVVAGAELDVVVVVAVEPVGAVELLELLEECLEPPQPAITAAAARTAQIMLDRLIVPA